MNKTSKQIMSGRQHRRDGLTLTTCSSPLLCPWTDADVWVVADTRPPDMKTENIDDTDSRFVYSSSDWVREDSGLNEWFGNTVHKTQEKGAFVDFK